jgi:hypothetical protein
MRPDQLLGRAVERGYAAFAHNRLGPTMVVRRRDVTPAEVAALSGPVRSVPATAVDRWLPHAVTTWGSEDDLRTLLPRVFELLTAGLLTTPPEVVFAKVRHADPPGWPIVEQTALADIVAALWLASLTHHPTPLGVPAGRVLTALAELGDDISAHLAVWAELLPSTTPDGEVARRHLVELVEQVDGLRQTGLRVADLFWSPRPDQAARLEQWLRSLRPAGPASA